MSLTFHAECEPGDDLLRRVAALAPANPFCTPAYVRARQALGKPVWILGVRRGDEWTWACPALAHPGRWGCALEIESLPSDPDPLFWQGLTRFCRARRVGFFEVWTMGTPSATLPALPGEEWRRPRVEYVIRLQGRDLWEALATNQKRNVKRARKGGVALRVTDDPAACAEHARLRALSMDRRRQRGESVAEGIRPEDHEVFLRAGAGLLFQAVQGDSVLSSALVLLAGRGAYYQTAGTNPEGMACGASPFLIHETARHLQRRSLEVFNLGGAGLDNPGLVRFKAELGAEPVPLESAGYGTGSRLWRSLKNAARSLRDGVRGLLRGREGPRPTAPCPVG
jgi:hypothetical protein